MKKESKAEVAKELKVMKKGGASKAMLAKERMEFSCGGKVKKYAGGGEVDAMEEANNSSESQDIASSMTAGEKNTEESSKPEYKSFKEAFAAERKAGNKTFEYMGKKYTTEMAARKEAPARKETPVNVEQSKTYAPGTSILDRSKADRDALVNLGLKRAEGERAVKAFKERNTPKYASGGVVARATAKSHGKAC